MRMNTVHRVLSTDRLDFLGIFGMLAGAGGGGGSVGGGGIDTSGRVFRDRLGTVGVPTQCF